MIITETHPEITTVGIGQEQHFSIGNVGRIIKILRSSMYADPIKAIAREISCNARDAHREVGTADLPIEIHLPNQFDSNYKIRDFGPGISPDRMSNVFLGYGNSTKTADNTQTGGFGLGAKTPFAYADQFTVSTITPNETGVNIKRVYIMYIGANEAGTSRLVSECETDEHTGTEIAIDVAQKDFSKFIRSTVDVCNYWTVRPTITGISTFTWDHDIRTRIITESDWELCGRGDPIIVIDGIEYPLNTYSLNLEYGTDAYQAARFGLVLRFNTGDLTLSANREQLQYDERTISAITAKLVHVVSVLPDKISERLVTATSYTEAVNIYTEVKNNIYSMRDIKPMWNGMIVTDRVYYRCGHSKSEDETIDYGWSYNIRLCSNQVKRTREHLSIDVRDFIPVSHSTQIIINDTGVLHKKTLQHYIKSNAGIGRVCVISSTHNKWDEILDRMAKDSSAGVNPTILGMVFMSDLPKPPVEKRAGVKGNRPKYSAFVYDKNYDPPRKQDSCWRPIDEVPDDGIFVTISGPGNKISSNGKNITFDTINSFLKLTDESVYAFRDKEAGNLDNDDWTPMLDKAMDIISDKLTDTGLSLVEIGAIVNNNTSLRQEVGWSIFKTITHIVNSGKVPATSKLAEIIKASSDSESLLEKVQPVWNLAKIFGMTSDISSDNATSINYGEMFYDAYPMIRHITYWPYDTSGMYDTVSDYINMCDSMRNSIVTPVDVAAE